MKTFDKLMLSLIGGIIIGLILFPIGLIAQCPICAEIGLGIVVVSFIGVGAMFAISK